MNRIAQRFSAAVLGSLLLCIATLVHADALNASER
jgi:hypothetical protein